jgi:hypothetical protein
MATLEDDLPPPTTPIHSKLILYITLLATYSAFILISLIFFIRLRHLPAFYYRSLPLTLALATCNVVLAALLLLREAVPTVPCLLSFWILVLIPPLYVVLLSARFIQLAIRYRVSEAALVAVQDDEGGGFKKEVEFVPGEATSKHLTEVNLDKVTSWHVSNRLRNLTHRGILLYCIVFLLVYVGAVLGFELAVGKGRQPLSAHELCTNGWSQLPQYSSLAFCVFLLAPAVVYSLMGKPDAYGIRAELITTVVLGILLSIASGVAMIYEGSFSDLWQPELVLCITLAVMHWVMVVQPVLSYAIARRRLGTTLENKSSLKQAFRVLLQDPLLFEEFKLFTVKDFSIENALFYEEMAKVRNRAGEDVSKDLLRLYQLFIGPMADYPLNLKAKTLRTIRESVQNNQLDVETFNEALEEVEQLMRSDTFVRFLRTKHREYKQDLLLRADDMNG